jgi:NADPH-dependent curcumin reductase CurA
MSDLISREIHLTSRPDGLPTPDNFTLVERVLTPADSDIVIRNLYMSVDPAMRPALSNGQTKLDEAMGGGAIGRVVESSSEEFPTGACVLHRSGFREYHLSDGSDLSLINPEDEALTTHLHILGGTGLTAYGGLLVTGQLTEGENVFVSAAAGAVGSVVCQIAKIYGCRVAGSCGSDDKVEYLLNELGIDYAFNYKTSSIARELHIGLPEGIDVYFENVGGAHLDAACGQMRPLGRIPVCGMISAYNNKGARSEGAISRRHAQMDAGGPDEVLRNDHGRDRERAGCPDRAAGGPQYRQDAGSTGTGLNGRVERSISRPLTRLLAGYLTSLP